MQLELNRYIRGSAGWQERVSEKYWRTRSLESCRSCWRIWEIIGGFWPGRSTSCITLILTSRLISESVTSGGEESLKVQWISPSNTKEWWEICKWWHGSKMGEIGDWEVEGQRKEKEKEKTVVHTEVSISSNSCALSLSRSWSLAVSSSGEYS